MFGKQKLTPTTADQTMADKAEAGDALGEAVELMKEQPKNGRISSEVANKAAANLGISESTWRRAKKRLEIVVISDDNRQTTHPVYKGHSNKRVGVSIAGGVQRHIPGAP